MLFLSKIRELRLVMRPKWVEKDPLTGVVVHPGKTIEFFDGRYETDDPEEIEFIKKNAVYGSRITTMEAGATIGSGRGVITGATATTVKQGRTFRCIRCGMDGFASGFEVAKHRKSGECNEVYEATYGKKLEDAPEEKSPEIGPSTIS